MELPRRLRKLLRDRTDLSLKMIDEAIASEQVTVNGAHPLPWGEVLVFPEDEVLLDGAPLPEPGRKRAFLLFKPKNVTSTATDPRGKRDLSVWLSLLPRGVFPVGRLDRETTGALLLTNDGNLATALLSPEHHASKVYWLWINESISEADPRLQQWLNGIPMLGDVARATRVEVLHQTEHCTELLVTLHEGKNRQIRRMAQASDFRLIHLHRKSICSLSLGTLSSGEVRELEQEEIQALWTAVGGKNVVFTKQWQALQQHARRAHLDGRANARLDDWLARNCAFIEAALIAEK